MPPDAATVGDIEGFQDWSSFAYGYELTLDPLFLRQAWTQAGGVDFPGLTQRLRNAGTANIENRAALLALVQKLNGEL
jgi:hypothetical protein